MAHGRPGGRIVGGGPRRGRGSLSREELEDLRDSGEFKSLAGSVAVFGIPAGTAPGEGAAPASGGGSFKAARGGVYVPCDADGYEPDGH